MIQTINFVPGDTVRVFEKVKEGDPSTGSGQVLVFVEVKTRTSNQFGSPLESITPWKLKTLKKLLNIIN